MNQNRVEVFQFMAVSAEAEEEASLLGDSYKAVFSNEFTRKEFLDLNEKVVNERERYPKRVYPPPGKVFAWSRHCHIENVKVVIIGQDPYPTPGFAHGLCFSVKKTDPPTTGSNPLNTLPPSLNNIFTELGRDPKTQFINTGHGDLTSWAEQGVLLLNSVLTYREGRNNQEDKINAHIENDCRDTTDVTHIGQDWENFTDAVIKYIVDNCSGVVFMLWGGKAQKKAHIIQKESHYLLDSNQDKENCMRSGGERGNDIVIKHPDGIPTGLRTVRDANGREIEIPKHYLFTASHPGNQSAYISFYGCGHFSAANRALRLEGKDTINW